MHANFKAYIQCLNFQTMYMHALQAVLLVQKQFSCDKITEFDSVVVITSVSHTEGREFEPRSN